MNKLNKKNLFYHTLLSKAGGPETDIGWALFTRLERIPPVGIILLFGVAVAAAAVLISSTDALN